MDETVREGQLTEADLDFLVEAVAPEAKNRDQIKASVRGDSAFRRAIATDDRVLQKLLADDEALVRVSPALYFEVLFRQALKELHHASHTVERSGRQQIPVFDAKEVVDLLSREQVLTYLAAMLSSFTRIQSYTVPVRVKPQVWRRIRFNDMDIDSLTRVAATVDEESRFSYYKRIADVCLFILGVYPEYADPAVQHPRTALRTWRGAQEYEEEGRRFYRLAGEHPAAATLELTGTFALLHNHFTAAYKPLNFISQHYLRTRRERLFQGQEG